MFDKLIFEQGIEFYKKVQGKGFERRFASNFIAVLV